MIETGVTFGTIHSFYDLNLILAPFVPTPAEPKTNYIDLPGADGSLDLTEALGSVKYKDREFEFTFSVNPSDTMTFDEKVSQVSNALNGRKCNICLDRDDDYYWEGRLSVNKYAQDGYLKQITVKATVRPYKLKKEETIVTVYLTSSEQIITVKNGRKNVIPEISCTGTMNLKFGSIETTVTAGVHTFLDVCFSEGENTLIMSGSGTAIIKFREGEL